MLVHAQVVSAACKALASLAAHKSSAAGAFAATAQNYLAALRQSDTKFSACCSRQACLLPCRQPALFSQRRAGAVESNR